MQGSLESVEPATVLHILFLNMCDVILSCVNVLCCARGDTASCPPKKPSRKGDWVVGRVSEVQVPAGSSDAAPWSVLQVQGSGCGV